MILRLGVVSSTVVSIVLGVSACTKAKPTSSLAEGTKEIFSDRPIAAEADVNVVSLKSPALLSTVVKTGSRWEIPATEKARLLAEHNEFERRLKAEYPQAQIIYRYKLAFNGMAVLANPKDLQGIEKLPGVTKISNVKLLSRPTDLNVAPVESATANKVNSSTFIGADKAYARGITGRGLRVGVIDTGIDFTHKMLGGSGIAADYSAINPSMPTIFFPNKKVVGGIDLAGSNFNAASPFASMRVPKPDNNPIDEAGHGSHVAGTIAGIGDGVNSFDGVAKDAELYAIKVFGKEGSTMDAIVIAALEYAADPNGDLILDDRLDVINLSLGGGFGQPQILYSEAVRNLTRIGLIVVAAAGNSGPVDYVVGAPSTSNEALSVAASIDGSEHNWKFPAVRFISPNNPDWLAKATEGPVSKPISSVGAVEGELVDIGVADQDLSDEVKAKLNGKIALVIRGKVPFIEKLRRAVDAGAIGAVVYNNEPGEPIGMGGEGKVDIPAIMVSLLLGQKLLEEMKLGPVRVQYKTDQWIEERQLIDQITSFSSKGPRSEDNLIKPEIAGPGQGIISAGMGKGAGVDRMDGTSMAAPHLAGAMALLKQAHPELTGEELKALAMNTAKVLSTGGIEYPMSLQGAGRVQLDSALDSPVVVSPSGISLGLISLSAPLSRTQTLNIRNFSDQPVTLDITVDSSAELEITTPPSVTIAARSNAQIDVSTTISLKQMTIYSAELNGRIYFKQDGKTVVQVPLLAIRTQASEVHSPATAAAGPVQLTNSSAVDGMALAFNLLGEDKVKEVITPTQSFKNKACDLQSVGYRTIRKALPTGATEFLQFAFKVYTPNTTWHLCEVSVLIDADGDGIADQEMAGVPGGDTLKTATFGTLLMDAKKARDIRLNYEKELALGKEGPKDFSSSLVARGRAAPFNFSTVVVIEIPVANLAKTEQGKLRVKAAALSQAQDTMQSDDFLGENEGSWIEIELAPQAQPFFGMPEFLPVSRGLTSMPLTKGTAPGKLVLYYPYNAFDSARDNQSQVLN